MAEVPYEQPGKGTLENNPATIIRQTSQATKINNADANH
ncbi:hypothetical protein FHT85_006022 [Rhizobium sp. BK312]|nr:hypothetical protein [Rhizobium sp. BK312]